MAKVDLVFRKIDERTADIALDLAIRHIRPDAVHVLDNVRPFSECVNRMLRIEHNSDYVVYVDADCLILEDMRGFIDRCDTAYVDTYVSDRFRGRIHCGVHVTRLDLVRRMAQIEPPKNDMKYVLRPESRLRNIAMKPLRMSKQFRNFDILHDHFQYFRHVFAKYAVRELRSRTPMQQARLDMAMQRWPQPNGGADDYSVARAAVEFTRRLAPRNSSAEEIDRLIRALPELAERELDRLGIKEKDPFSISELNAWLEKNAHAPAYGVGAQKPKVFGIGLSRTGTRSLTHALQILGFDTVHYPVDRDTYNELAYGQYDLTLLKHHDGVTDITVAPYYPQLDQHYPGAKFILTVRDKESWLQSCQNHWFNSPAFKETEDPDEAHRYRVRQLFRAATYGCYDFVPERFSWVYDQHVKAVAEYFRDRPQDLLVIDICSGEGFEKLAPFLGRPVPATPFPHNGSVVSRQVAQLRAQAQMQMARGGGREAATPEAV
ncbi:MAG: hypothetical protein KIS81_11770 [Maricaulaceae bacterium]|nr:hypothetical protein [Maricaulaceae bacterium]